MHQRDHALRRILFFFAAATIGQACSCEDDLYAVEGSSDAGCAEESCLPEPPDPGGSVAGCVCDEAVGAWVVGANVFLVEPDGDVVVTGTDAGGCFLLENVEPGEHVVRIELAPFSRDIPVTVVTGQQTSVPSPATCEPPDPGEVGAVEGRVCAPDGSTWLGDATVYVELPDDTRVQTSTDADGRYRLESVPAGPQSLHIEKGSFVSTREIEVAAGETLTIPEEECELGEDIAIAVVTGRNDDVGGILESIGIDPASITTFEGSYSTAWGTELLEDYAALSQFDIVFINCGANGIDDYPLLFLSPSVVNSALAVENLRQFVDEGGSVYASDEAYDLIERAWPDFVDFYGDDAVVDEAQIGVQESDPVEVRITEPSLATAMGVTSFDIHFNYTLWAIVTDVAPGATVYTRGDAPTSEGVMVDAPLTVGFAVGQGRVLYTSFHQEAGANSATQALLRLLMFEL